MPDLPDDIASQINDLEGMLQVQPTAGRYAQLADLYRTNGQLELAIEKCQQGLKAFPDNIDCLMTYSRALVDSSRFEEAENILKRIIELGGEDAGTLILMGQLYSQRNDLAGIHSIATKLSINYQNDIRAKKFLKFLSNKNLLPPGIETSDDTPKTAVHEPKPPEPFSAEIPETIFPDLTPEEPATEKPKTITPSTIFEESADTATSQERETTSRQAAPQVDTEVPQSAAPPPAKPSPQKAPVKKKPIPASTHTFAVIPLDDLLQIISMLKGISGVHHAVLTDPKNKTLASRGCPPAMARAVGGMLRSLKKAMHVAFNALDFGIWFKGVMETENITVHLIRVEEYWLALLCDPSVSLGALRIAVTSIIKRQLKPIKLI